MVTNTFAQFVATVNAGIEHINKSVSAGNAVNCGSYERVEVCASNEANAAFAMYKKLPIEVQFKLCQATAAAYYYVFNSHGATENSTLGHALRLYENGGNVILELMSLGAVYNVNVLQTFTPY